MKIIHAIGAMLAATAAHTLWDRLQDFTAGYGFCMALLMEWSPPPKPAAPVPR